jgi:RecA-family ATPase
MCILDPLMMIAGGGFDEFKAFEFMEKVLKPLKRVRARTGAAIVLVHHHLKGSTDAGAKSMYGSVALWAWEEAALHLQISGVGKVTAERFSKHSLLPPITIEIGDVSEVWSPAISTGASTELYDVLQMFEGGATVDELMGHTQLSRDVITRQLKALEGQGKVEKAGTETPPHGGRPRTKWKVK